MGSKNTTAKCGLLNDCHGGSNESAKCRPTSVGPKTAARGLPNKTMQGTRGAEVSYFAGMLSARP